MLSNKRSEENDYGIHPSPSQHDFDAFFNPAIFFQVRSEAESSSPSFRLPHHFDSEGDCYPRLLSVRLARKNQSLFRFKIVDIFKSARKDQRLLQILRFLGARCFQGEVYGGRTLELKKSRNVITGSTGWQEIDDDLSSLSTKDDDENVEEDAEQKRLKQFLSSVASKNGNSLQEKLIHARNNIFRNEAWRVFCSRRPFSSAVTLRWSLLPGRKCKSYRSGRILLCAFERYSFATGRQALRSPMRGLLLLVSCEEDVRCSP
eukprot:767174-Hanusia_phi.AAC.6